MDSLSLLKYPIVFLVAFTVTYLVTPLMTRLAYRLGVTDAPGERRLNQREIPRAGGVAVYLGFFVSSAMVAFFLLHSMAAQLTAESWVRLMLGGTFVLFLGLLDDIRSLKPHQKLLGQIVAALMMYSLGVEVNKILSIELPELINLLATVSWFLAFINAFNLIDGLDGLATGLATIAATGMLGAMIILHQPGDALILLAVIGSCMAFLKYNFYPAKIFLGDSGSMFLGFMLAAIALGTGAKGTALASVGIPLLAAGVPIFDTMLAVWRRSMRAVLARQGAGVGGRGIMCADMEHLHHRLLELGLTQRKVGVFLYLCSLSLVAVGLLSMLFSSSATGIFLIAFTVGTYVAVRHIANIELWDSGTVILQGLKQPSVRILATTLYPAIDFALLVFSWGLAILLFSNLPFPESKLLLISSLPMWCGLPFICVALSKAYRRVWSRARISEFLGLAISLVIGVAITLGITLIFKSGRLEVAVQAIFFHTCLSVLLILGVRAFPKTVQDLMFRNSEKQSVGRVSSVKNVIIFGAGNNALSLLRSSASFLQTNGSHAKILGFIDQDRNLRKRLVYGHQVLGELKDLPRLMEERAVDIIVVTERMLPSEQEILLKIVATCHLSVLEWTPELRTLAQGEMFNSLAILRANA